MEDGRKRRRLWDLADRVYPKYAEFREEANKTGRVIPLVQLIPRERRGSAK